jgi:hypothetical protein
MPGQLVIESPDFERIKGGDLLAIADAIRLLWFVLNQEVKDTIEIKDLLNSQGALVIADPAKSTATAQVGKCIIFVDPADGDLKAEFADGFTATIAADS